MTNTTLCGSLAMHPREEPPVHGALLAHHEGLKHTTQTWLPTAHHLSPRDTS